MRTVKSGGCSFLNKILTIFRRSSDLFTTSSELVMEKNREPNDGVDFSENNASELHSDSKPLGLPKDSWFGQKHFECTIAYDLFLQTAAGESTSAITVSHRCSIPFPMIGCWKEPITDYMLCTW